MASSINTNTAPPPAAQTLIQQTKVQPAKVDQTPAAATQGPRDQTPAVAPQPLPLATSGSLGTRINTSA